MRKFKLKGSYATKGTRLALGRAGIQTHLQLIHSTSLFHPPLLAGQGQLDVAKVVQFPSVLFSPFLMGVEF